jgi:hypothetical protein
MKMILSNCTRRELRGFVGRRLEVKLLLSKSVYGGTVCEEKFTELSRKVNIPVTCKEPSAALALTGQ